MPKSRHTSLIPSPSRSRATKRRRSSITEVSLHGINTSRQKRKVLPMSPVQFVTYLSGRTPLGCKVPSRSTDTLDLRGRCRNWLGPHLRHDLVAFLVKCQATPVAKHSRRRRLGNRLRSQLGAVVATCRSWLPPTEYRQGIQSQSVERPQLSRLHCIGVR